MQIYRNLVPVLSLLVAVILAVLPWGLSDVGRLAIVLIPGSIIFYWVMSAPGMLSVFSVFTSGFVLDVLGGSHLGHWALVHLIVYGVSVLLLRLDFMVLGIRSFLFPGVVVSMLVMIYALSTVVIGLLPVWTFLNAGVIAVLCYPLVFGVLWVLDRPGLMGRTDTARAGLGVLP